MDDIDYKACNIAAWGVDKAIGRLNGTAGKAIGDWMSKACDEKQKKDKLWNAQLDHCWFVARADDNATTNVRLQESLLELVELSAIDGNCAQKHFFRITYLQESKPPLDYGKWYPYKWKKISYHSAKQGD